MNTHPINDSGLLESFLRETFTGKVPLATKGQMTALWLAANPNFIPEHPSRWKPVFARRVLNPVLARLCEAGFVRKTDLGPFVDFTVGQGPRYSWAPGRDLDLAKVNKVDVLRNAIALFEAPHQDSGTPPQHAYRAPGFAPMQTLAWWKRANDRTKTVWADNVVYHLRSMTDTLAYTWAKVFVARMQRDPAGARSWNLANSVLLTDDPGIMVLATVGEGETTQAIVLLTQSLKQQWPVMHRMFEERALPYWLY